MRSRIIGAGSGTTPGEPALMSMGSRSTAACTATCGPMGPRRQTLSCPITLSRSTLESQLDHSPLERSFMITSKVNRVEHYHKIRLIYGRSFMQDCGENMTCARMSSSSTLSSLSLLMAALFL